MRVIFVLLGEHGAGKDTAVKAILQQKDIQRVAFADALKEYVASAHQIGLHHFHDNKLKDSPLPIAINDIARNQFPSFCSSSQLFWTPRQLLLLEGAAKKAVNKNFWIDKAVQKIKATCHHIIITDCRYAHEFAAVKNLPYSRIVSIRIERTNETNTAVTCHADDEAESFARHFKNADFTIINDSSIEELQSRMQHIVTQCLS